jgi:hypothetical protein
VTEERYVCPNFSALYFNRLGRETLVKSLAIHLITSAIAVSQSLLAVLGKNNPPGKFIIDEKKF